MFKDDRFFIFGGSRNFKKKIWNQNGESIGEIQKSNLNYGRFIEATYIDNKAYILLSGNHHSECLDYNDNNLKTYKNNNKNCSHLIVNLFKKDENIFLITGDESGNCCIFDFKTTNLINEIELGYNIKALCSFSNKFLIIADCNLIKIINMENYTIIKTFSEHNAIFGIEKIKIPEKGEFIISYDSNSIKIWK